MKIQELVIKFSSREVVPIDVSEVEAEIKASGIKDEIFCWPVEVTNKLFGKINHWEYPDGASVRRCADIYYGKDLSKDWQRIVCCKEILHLLDPKE